MEATAGRASVERHPASPRPVKPIARTTQATSMTIHGALPNGRGGISPSAAPAAVVKPAQRGRSFAFATTMPTATQPSWKVAALTRSAGSVGEKSGPPALTTPGDAAAINGRTADVSTPVAK